MATSKRKPFRNAILLLLIIIAPVLGAILLKSGQNHYKRLPFVGEGYPVGMHIKRGDTIIDSVHHQVRAWHLTNQDGQASDTNFVHNKDYVMNGFFTTCPNICKDMTKAMRSVQMEFAANKEVALISYSVDPENDTPEKLKAYAERYSIDTKQWALLTGPKDSVYDLLKYSYFQIIEKLPNGKDFIHSPNMLLVDKLRHIRGIYDGTKDSEVIRLKEDLKVLQKEEGMDYNKSKLP